MSSCHSHINLPRHYPLKAKSRMLGHITLGWWFTVSIWSKKHHANAKWYTLFKSIHQVWHVYKIKQLIQWSDKCDTSLAVESAPCTTGSPRRWSQRVSRKCCKSVGAAKDVIMPLSYQLAKALPCEKKWKIKDARSFNLWVECSLFLHDQQNIMQLQNDTHYLSVGETRVQDCATQLQLIFSDQTTAIPHWLWNQPSAPPVHPEDGVKGCLGNAVKVSECHHATAKSTFQGATLRKKNQGC